MAVDETEIKSAIEIKKLKALSIPGKINVEYLLHLSLELTPAQKHAIYKIMMTYPFPMNTNPLNKRIIEQLSPEDQHSLYHFEMLFLQRKLNEVAAGVTLLAIPKTAYQFFHVVQYYSQGIQTPCFSLATRYTDDKSMYESIWTKLDDPESQVNWWAINDALLQYWMNSESLDEFIESLMKRLVDTITDNFETIPEEYLFRAECGRALGTYLRESGSDNIKKAIDFLKAVIHREWDERSSYLLYCAIRKGETDLKPSAAISWSFSDGLVSGFLHDLGACTFHLLLHMQWMFPRELYTFSLKKNSYLTQNSIESNILFIPPIPSFLRDSGAFEFFHARTKISSRTEHKVRFGGEATSGTVRTKIGVQPVFIANNLEPSLHEKALQLLCEECYKKTPIENRALPAPFLGFQYPQAEPIEALVMEQNVRRAMSLN